MKIRSEEILPSQFTRIETQYDPQTLPNSRINSKFERFPYKIRKITIFFNRYLKIHVFNRLQITILELILQLR